MIREIDSQDSRWRFLIEVNPYLQGTHDTNFVHDLAWAIEATEFAISAEADWASQTILVRVGGTYDHEHYLRIFCDGFYAGWSRSCADPPLMGEHVSPYRAILGQTIRVLWTDLRAALLHEIGGISWAAQSARRRVLQKITPRI